MADNSVCQARRRTGGGCAGDVNFGVREIFDVSAFFFLAFFTNAFFGAKLRAGCLFRGDPFSEGMLMLASVSFIGDIFPKTRRKTDVKFFFAYSA